jgi:hypothetical protein
MKPGRMKFIPLQTQIKKTRSMPSRKYWSIVYGTTAMYEVSSRSRRVFRVLLKKGEMARIRTRGQKSTSRDIHRWAKCFTSIWWTLQMHCICSFAGLKHSYPEPMYTPTTMRETIVTNHGDHPICRAKGAMHLRGDRSCIPGQVGS